MNLAASFLTPLDSLPEWLDVLLIIALMLVAGLVLLIWFTMFRRKKRRRHRRHHPHYHAPKQTLPTLAQTGGLPPAREEKKTDQPMPPT
jgi:hypothetical protein